MTEFPGDQTVISVEINIINNIPTGRRRRKEKKNCIFVRLQSVKSSQSVESVVLSDVDAHSVMMTSSSPNRVVVSNGIVV